MDLINNKVAVDSSTKEVMEYINDDIAGIVEEIKTEINNLQETFTDSIDEVKGKINSGFIDNDNAIAELKQTYGQETKNIKDDFKSNKEIHASFDEKLQGIEKTLGNIVDILSKLNETSEILMKLQTEQNTMSKQINALNTKIEQIDKVLIDITKVIETQTQNTLVLNSITAQLDYISLPFYKRIIKKQKLTGKSELTNKNKKEVQEYD